MKLTTNIIMDHNPCGQYSDGKTGISKLMNYLNQSSVNDNEFTLIDVLKSNGIKDAVWCLRCFDYLDVCLFMADVAESVLDIYEKSNSNSKAPRKLIQDLRDFKTGKITKDELSEIRRSAAHAAAHAASYDYDHATGAVHAASYDYAYVTAAAHAAVHAASYDYACVASYDYAYVTAAAHAATPAVYDTVTNTAANTAAYDKKWDEIKELFIKHFGEIK